jgi:putative spermidine/putrescine transport system permease protein
VGIALFGFSLSYDEFPRTMMTAGDSNTLPLEIFAMTANVTTPVIYALGTLTTAFSSVVIIVAITTMSVIRRRRLAKL